MAIYPLHSISTYIYFIVLYLFRSTDDVSLSLIRLVHVVDQEETRYGVGHRLSVSSPLCWGVGDAYDVCGASMCPWHMGGGLEPIAVLPSSLQLLPSGNNALRRGVKPVRTPVAIFGSLGVFLCAGKPPLADIILSHPPDLTRCDSVIGLAIPAMSGHIQYRGAAS